MERPKLTSDQAAAIINTLRANPGVSMTLGDISDETGLPADELAAYLDEIVSHGAIERDTTEDGFDMFRFPDHGRRHTGE